MNCKSSNGTKEESLYDRAEKPYSQTTSAYYAFGYLGKPYDSTAKLYNYGYRDYNSQQPRFTTVAPIRDGPNWFTYCNSDPVNFVDLWGLNASDASNTIQLINPTTGKVSSEYGERESFITKTGRKTKEGHGGIDIANQEGTPIVAAADGKVLENSYSEVYGNYVIICHPAQSGWKGLLTYYAHLKSPSPLPAGTPVKQGEEIGKMGDTGLADGSHLHFEVRTDYGYSKHNPRDYIGFGD